MLTIGLVHCTHTERSVQPCQWGGSIDLRVGLGWVGGSSSSILSRLSVFVRRAVLATHHPQTVPGCFTDPRDPRGEQSDPPKPVEQDGLHSSHRLGAPSVAAVLCGEGRLCSQRGQWGRVNKCYHGCVGGGGGCIGPTFNTADIRGTFHHPPTCSSGCQPTPQARHEKSVPPQAR